MTQIQPATGLLLPADADQPVRTIQVRPDNTRDMAKLIGCQWIELVRTPIENVAMIVNEEGLLADKRLNMLASTLYPGPIVGDVLLLGLEGPATTWTPWPKSSTSNPDAVRSTSPRSGSPRPTAVRHEHHHRRYDRSRRRL